METENKKTLSFNEAADFLGYRKSYLYKLTSKGKIPHVKPTNGRIFFDKEKIEAWMLRPIEKKPKVKKQSELEDMVFSSVLKAIKLTKLSESSFIPESPKQLING